MSKTIKTNNDIERYIPPDIVPLLKHISQPAGAFFYSNAYRTMHAIKKAPYRGFWGFWRLSADICTHICAPLEKYLRNGIKRLFLSFNMNQVTRFNIIEL